MNQSVSTICLHDLEGRFLDVNAIACAHTGYSREELLGMTVFDLYSTGAESLTMDVLRQWSQWQPEQRHTIEMEHQRKDGTVFPVDISTGVVCFAVRDVIECMRAEEALRRAHVELEQRVRELTADLSAANSALRRERRTLEYMLRASDHERRLIAYDIHDGLAQELAGAVMQFQVYQQQKDARPQDAQKAFDGGMTLLRQGHSEARRLISGVRPPILDESGVVAAIAHLVHDPSFDHGPRVDFRSRVTFTRLERVMENAIYRIVQEGLSNARKHSQSPRITVSIVQRGDRLRLQVRDWGVGFDPQRVPEDRFGLVGIRERARLLGGRCRVRSTPGKGTAFVVDLPVVSPQEAPA